MQTLDQFDAQQAAERLAFTRRSRLYTALPEAPRSIRTHVHRLRVTYSVSNIEEAMKLYALFDTLPYYVIREGCTTICLEEDAGYYLRAPRTLNDTDHYLLEDGCPWFEVDNITGTTTCSLCFYSSITMSDGAVEKFRVVIEMKVPPFRPQKVAIHQPAPNGKARVVGYRTEYPVNIHEDQRVNWSVPDTSKDVRTTFLWAYETSFVEGMNRLREYAASGLSE